VFLDPGICLAGLIAGLLLERGNGAAESPWHGWAVAAYCASYAAGGWHAAWIALHDLLHGRANIDLLMVVAAGGSAVLGSWWEGAVLLFLFSLSHSLETFILGRTRRAIAALMDLAPDEALRLKDGREERVPVDALVPGDVILVHPSQRIPVDGVIRQGHTSVDQAIMTGESMPVDKLPGDLVFTGTLNQQGVIEVEVTRTAGETTLARMVRLVEQAQSERATTQQFSAWFGQRYTWIVLALAAVSFVWYHLGTSARLWEAFSRAMTILVVASPCAVVISIPAAILTAITAGARNGVLFKGGVHIERTATLQAMAFDKTGTLTIGKPQLVQIKAARGVSENDLLSWVAAVEAHSEHPLAQAVVQGAKGRGLDVPEAENVESIVGSGIRGTVAGSAVLVGKPEWIAAEISTQPDAILKEIEAARAAGQTVLAVARQGRLVGWLGVEDTLRETARAAVQELRDMGLRPLLMLSGDNIRVAAHLADQLELDYRANLQPGDKLVILKGLINEPRRIGMIGDGTNDAPALATATVGFSLGGAGSDVALETADVVLMSDDLRRLPYAIRLARRTQVILKQNLVIAFGVMIALLIASVWTPLPLPIAVLGHEGSTVLVILNGLRLLLWSPRKRRAATGAAHPLPQPG
jgi:Cd2+/Zn2+-exporting ATPase